MLGSTRVGTWGVRSRRLVFGLELCWACAPLPQASTEPDAVEAKSTPQTHAAAASAQSKHIGAKPEPTASVAESKEVSGINSNRASAPSRVGPPRDVAVRGAPPTSVAPLPVVPPYAGTASAEDGRWREFGADQGGAMFWRTLLHPNEKSRFVSVDVVALDLQRFRLEWVVGVGDVGASTLVGKQTPGLVDATSTDAVVAVFNGGFQARHGYWGQQSHGITLVKPKADGCGIALYDDGRVALGSYETCVQPGLLTYRQAPPCLVNNGQLNPRLAQGRDAIWAGKSAAEKTRRRSAVGLTRDRQTLFYLVGVETEPVDLGRALLALGVEYGLQLDINWNWTRFFLTEGGNEAKTLGTPLIPGMVADKGEYFRRPSKRDFFAVLRRPAQE